MNDNKEYLTFRVRRYTRNLLQALQGNNPYKMELDDARKELEKARENMRLMQQQYCSALERWSESQRMLEDAVRQLEAAI